MLTRGARRHRFQFWFSPDVLETEAARRHYAAMHNERFGAPARAIDDVRLKLIEAIVRVRAVVARYNGELMKLAPHILFERHGDLFVSALNLGKNRPTEEAVRLGQFKLAGLEAVELLDEPFEPIASLAAAPPRPDDILVLAI